MEVDLVLFLNLCLVCAVASQKFDGVVRHTSDGHYEAYMIPPNVSNHASFLELLPSGELLMAWFSGLAEGANNCSIVLARLPPGGSQWSKAEVVSWRVDYSNQNPVLFLDGQTAALHLFHSQQPASSVERERDGARSEEKAHIWTLVSADGRGLRWTEPALLFEKDGSFDRNRIILSLNGSWIYPVYYAVSGSENQYSSMKISTNHKDWVGFPIKDSNYLVQPSVIRPVNATKHLLAYFRDRRHENIYAAESLDEGVSWSKPRATSLENNNAAIQATVLHDGSVVILYNPTHSQRYPMRVSLSEDGGKTWAYSRDIETKPSGSEAVDEDVEYSYPTVLQAPDGWIHASYTYNRQTIKYVKFSQQWIKEKSCL